MQCFQTLKKYFIWANKIKTTIKIAQFLFHLTFIHLLWVKQVGKHLEQEPKGKTQEKGSVYSQTK